MRVTRRYWTVVGLGAVLLAGAVLFERAFLLVGAATVGAWLLARQYLFVRSLVDLDDRLTVDQTVTPGRVATGEDVQVTLAASLDVGSALPLRVESNPPVAAVGSTRAERVVEIAPGGSGATAAYTVSVPTAGAFAFDAATVAVGDRAGLFRETLARGSAPTLRVRPRAPRNVHVGEGGEEIATAFGEHEAGRLGSGLEPAELREYVAGDAAGRIDWKATARLGRPFVREFEPETDRTTVLLVDHRAAMNRGPEGETKLDYAREVALAFLDSARELNDPLGLYTVGDGGLTGRDPPDAGPQQYATVRTRLEDLRPTPDPRDATTSAAVAAGRAPGEPSARTPAEARRAAARLRGDDQFAATLRPYLEDAAPYVERIEGEPLFGTARAALTRLRGTLWTVVMTDDSNPAEVRETVKLARRGDDYVLVFLAPSVLFEPGGLGDLERAYDRYLEFEAFRRDLARLDRVRALEVGPGDRLSAVLAGRRDRRRERGVGGR